MNFTIKPIYLFFGAAIALSACTHDDDMPGRVEVDSNRINFQMSLPASRAMEVTEKSLPYFQVTAFDTDDMFRLTDEGYLQPLFANEKVEIARNKAPYSSPYCMWPDPGKESHRVTFFAFYPGLDELGGATLNNTSSPIDISYRLAGIRVNPDIAEQKDFVTAYATGTMEDDQFSGILLPFAHQLSRIEVKAYGAHKSCDIEIAGVRIGGTGVGNTFAFKAIEGGGEWFGEPTRGIVEYIYREGDKIVTFGKSHRVGENDAFSIMGAKRSDGNENCAMLLPSSYAEWDYAKDRHNDSNQMYISVLIRLTDATPTAGIRPADKQLYPYRDLTQGKDALEIAPAVYLAVNKSTGVVAARLYKDGDSYFKDPDHEIAYTLPATEEIKEFGWAALPVTGNWAPGYIYTYTLDYTLGVGLLDPEVTTTAPGAGDPVISDRVGLIYSVKKWKVGGGDEFRVPGS